MISYARDFAFCSKLYWHTPQVVYLVYTMLKMSRAALVSSDIYSMESPKKESIMVEKLHKRL